ncbi:cbs pb1 domain-containing protein [Lichtheimia corymbifera JMRC:FSU:9682]|uniref:Cbs pb1 domain-containing protein n=1 Tax=Lichtheimia corymbifera JMRC:FSU:9682 TaxID=1263082 RepID=A0A068S989_9FUNG|nr:cbs pb1 domain-containing protein [Lichtheimia corymbifera JMRC:FSU:9682]
MPKRSGSRIPSVASSRAETSDHTNLGSRQRQSKRDEAIRKKLEQELSRKQTSTSRVRQTRKIAGTVSALRPTQALTVKENLLVIEASQLMAAKRSNCVLVVDNEDHLSGIFTAKDLAYRVVAESLDARATTVAEIMTQGPMCVTADTSATDALNLMVSRGFRHLPVCNEEGDIFGLLDITKCLYEALDKMERAYGSSRKLYDALEGVEREWNTNSPAQLVQYMESLRDRMSCPDLGSVMDGTAPAEVNVKTNVRDVARIMKEHRTTAVLVADREGLAGIFTTKDVVLRVIAAGLNPENCSVVRVMTPHPETAPPSTTIMDALRRMNDGHFLNLPVMDAGVIVGMVDVLKLTYATLEQIHSMQGSDGPMWSRFWDSFGANEAESESQSSDPSANHSGNHSRSPVHGISPEPSGSFSQLQGFPEITPNESASMVNHEDTLSATSSHQTPPSRITQKEPVDDDTFAFKFTSTGGKTHRFTSPINSYSQLIETVRQKVINEHVATEADDSTEWLSISYLDDENDKVLISSDMDVKDAVQLARKLGNDRVKLFVHDLTQPEERSTPQVETAAATMDISTTQFDNSGASTPTTVPAPPSKHENDRSIRSKRSSKRNSRRMASDSESDDEHYREPSSAFPQEIMLPAAIAFLGVVILGVFAYSRVSPKHR